MRNRGVFRLWIFLSAISVATIIWRSDLSCPIKNILGVTAPWCQFSLVDPKDYYVHLIFRIVGAPLIVALGIVAIIWVIRGFKAKR